MELGPSGGRVLVLLVVALVGAGGLQLYAVAGLTDGSLKYLVIGLSAIAMMVLLGAIAWMLRADAV
ncbi:MAG: hypothetical protein ABEJ78_09860 [Haloferacaceae archaeon]